MSFAWLNPSERGELLGFMEERFGIPPSRFDGFRLFTRGEHVHALAEEAAGLAEGMICEDAGLQLVKLTHSGFHKPVTRGVQVFGDAATKNVIEITLAELKSLIEGRRVAAPDYKGFVILRFRGRPLGVGLCREGSLESQLPRSMTEHLVLSAAENLV